MDCLPPRRNSHYYEEIIAEFITKGNLIDFWRMRNPNVKQFTWYNWADNGQCSRLDFWLMSTNLINKVLKCEISASPLTDHGAISMSFQPGGVKHIPNYLWKFNSSLLDNEEFCNETKKLVKQN